MKKYGLSASERIKGKKDFELVYTRGEVLFSSDKQLRAHFLILANSKITGSRFGVAVSKKLGNAVRRNRVKRLIREAYRLNKADLLDKSTSRGSLLSIIFSPLFNQKSKNKVTISDIEDPIREIISLLKEKL